MANMKIIIACLLLPLVSSLTFGDDEFVEKLKSYGFTKGYDEPSLRNYARVQYDFIVVGAGSGGSAVANRLSENPDWNVLLLEAGQPEGIPNQVPMMTGVIWQTDYNYKYKTVPQKHACFGMINHQCSWPRGKSLGGSSTLNGMAHTRGNKLDFDGWAALGNDGWSYDEVLPFFKKSEKFNVEGVTNPEYHGTDGYVHVESVPYRTPLATEFIKAGVQLGYQYQPDYNGEDQEGFAYLQEDMDNGTRCSAAKAYLSINRPNLDILTGAQATKILIARNKRAYGVQYVLNGSIRQVYATKEVILSAGTIDSAKLLMLSGIGPKEHLRELGIPVIKDSKVGYNLREHVGFMGPTVMVNKNVTVLASRLTEESVIYDYGANHRGPISLPATLEALAFVKTKYAVDDRPDMELLFLSSSLHSDNGAGLKKGHRVTDEVYDTVFKPVEGMDGFSIWPIGLNPRSHGRLTLKSKNPSDPPIMQPNFFEDPVDLETIFEGLKIVLDLIKTEYFQAYGAKLLDTKIPGCQSYDFNTDDYWRCAIAHLPGMMNHEVGTCKMGPASDPDAVVDPQLRVRGIRGLRVVDASIMPTLITGHTNAVIFMIGERGADFIKQSWQTEPSLCCGLGGNPEEFQKK